MRRVVRAIEIYLLTGKTKTEHDRLAISNSPYNSVIIALDYADREILYSRINSRVDAMISAGLENEVRELYASGCLYPDTTAGQAIGYKEMLDYIRGIDTLEAAVEKIKLGTFTVYGMRIDSNGNCFVTFKSNKDSVKIEDFSKLMVDEAFITFKAMIIGDEE